MADIIPSRGAPPAFNQLRLNVMAAKVGAGYVAELTGRTVGSELRMTDNGDGRFRLSGTTVSGDGLKLGEATFAVTEYPGSSGVPFARETVFRLPVGHDAALPPRQPNAFTGSPAIETLREDGATIWQRLGPACRMMLQGDALQAFVQIEKSATDPAVSATPVPVGGPRHLSSLGLSDAPVDMFFRDEIAWYRVKVSRLVGSVSIRLGAATMMSG